MNSKSKVDVLIVGGGLAGLTLALQLKSKTSSLSIQILEKRADLAPTATHKVGESVVELGAHYLRGTLGLKDYLNENHLPKYGFRFFFHSESKLRMEERIEAGTITIEHAPSNHIDRGLFENDLVIKLQELGVEILLGATVEDIDLSPNGHKVNFSMENESKSTTARWLVDTSGRRSFLKRKLGIQKDLDHNVNAVWFRLKHEVDVNNWSSDPDWLSSLGSGLRRLATNHLMGEGYWVWIIPLVGGSTSIGIVADESFHSLNSINSFDKAVKWLEQFEPIAAKVVIEQKEELLDFKIMKHFAHDVKQNFSTDRWAITGEAGAFLDAFYSPGTDFIALGNTWTADLIERDFKGEDINLRLSIYEHAQRELIDGWFTLYQNKYAIFGKTQVLLAKVIWDWATYWAIIVPMFINNGYTDLETIKIYSSNKHQLGLRFTSLNNQMQKLFLDWGKKDNSYYLHKYLNIFDLEFLHTFHLELKEKLNQDQLIERIKLNLSILEKVAAEMFRYANFKVNKTIDNGAIDPYNVSLESTVISNLNKNSIEVYPDSKIQKDLAFIWLDESKTENLNLERIAENMQEVQHVFMKYQNENYSLKDIKSICEKLDLEPREFRSVAYESVSMMIGLACINDAGDFDAWFDFFEMASEENKHHIAIGLGWSFAKENKDPKTYMAIDSNDYLISMVFNGMGYYDALYRPRKTIKEKTIPENLNESNLSFYYQGIGRRLWYNCKGQSSLISEMINSFIESARADLWTGLGSACAYVGGCNEKHLFDLLQASGDYSSDLKQGMLPVLINDLERSRNIVDTKIYCKEIFGIELPLPRNTENNSNDHFFYDQINELRSKWYKSEIANKNYEI